MNVRLFLAMTLSMWPLNSASANAQAGLDKGTVSPVAGSKPTEYKSHHNLARRVVVLPLIHKKRYKGQGVAETFKALHDTYEKIYPMERFEFVEPALVMETLAQMGRNSPDSFLEPYTLDEVAEIARILQANSVVYGVIRVFTVELYGFTPMTTFDADVSLFKLDQNKVVFTTIVNKTRSGIDTKLYAGAIASAFYSRLRKQYGSFTATNLHGDQPLVLEKLGETWEINTKESVRKRKLRKLFPTTQSRSDQE